MSFSESVKKEYYKALVSKDSKYEGIFYYALDTTGTFCRPTCPSRKPKFENCRFYKTIEEAHVKYRPCLRCHPTGYPNILSPILLEIEKHPEKNWHESDFSKYGITPVTLRRHFLKRFGVTFSMYLRMCRLEKAVRLMRSGKTVIEAQQTLGYESSSGFRDASYRVFGIAPSRLKNIQILKSSLIDTPLGPMTAVADDKYLYFLDFSDNKESQKKIEAFKSKPQVIIFPGKTTPISRIEKELQQYFKGNLTVFTTPLWLEGSPSQKQVWVELQKIPFGQMCRYSDSQSLMQAKNFAIVIPFHRVLNNKEILKEDFIRNEWLKQHEQVVCRRSLS